MNRRLMGSRMNTKRCRTYVAFHRGGTPRRRRLLWGNPKLRRIEDPGATLVNNDGVEMPA